MARSNRPNIFYGVTLHLWNAAQWTKTHKKVQICFEICFKLVSSVATIGYDIYITVKTEGRHSDNLLNKSEE